MNHKTHHGYHGYHSYISLLSDISQPFNSRVSTVLTNTRHATALHVDNPFQTCWSGGQSQVCKKAGACNTGWSGGERNFLHQVPRRERRGAANIQVLQEVPPWIQWLTPTSKQNIWSCFITLLLCNKSSTEHRTPNYLLKYLLSIDKNRLVLSIKRSR